MRKSVGKKLIFLFAALCILVAFACVSVSKFVLTDKKELVGRYTDFVLSHDGNGQTVVVQKNNDNTETGYIVTTVSNFTAEKISKRDVRFYMRTPTADELAAGSVSDAWGNVHSVASESSNYEVSIVDANGAPLTATSDATYLSASGKHSSALILKITRKSGGSLGDDTERLSVILQTSLPYIDLQVFTVNVTAARLSIGVTSDTYQGYNRQIVNLKSAIDFIRNAEISTGSDYLATVEFTLSGQVVFDALLYEETYGAKPVYNESRSKVVIIIRAGADVNLYFYTRGSCEVTVSATINDGAGGNEKISGVDETTKIVFSK